MLENGSTSLLDSHEKRLDRVETHLESLSGMKVQIEIINSGMGELKNIIKDGFDGLNKKSDKLDVRVSNLEIKDQKITAQEQIKAKIRKAVIGGLITILSGAGSVIAERLIVHGSLFTH